MFETSLLVWTTMKVIALLICFAATSCIGKLNVHDKMYTLLDATTPCILRLNGSQSFGCTSSRAGNVGVVHMVHNSSDLNWVLESAPMDSYIVALYLNMFSFSNLKKMNDSARISGVLLMQNSSRKDVAEFSPEDTCPNRYSGLAGPPLRESTCNPEQPWNPRTIYSSISMHKWKIPIFFTDDADTTTQVEDCFHKFNSQLETQLERPLCALKMSAHMYGSLDSTTCIRRSFMPYNINPIRYCDPLGDLNIWAPVVPFSKVPIPNQKYIIVAARLDSTSLFYGLAPGALSTATSLVTLMSTAHLLFDLTLDIKNFKQNVLFVLFNGEAYDYIGSSRVVYDMNRGLFPFKEHPIHQDDISLFVELSQLRNDPYLVCHMYKSADARVANFISKFNGTSAAFGFPFTVSDSPSSSFPPASFQSFLAKKENMSGFVFSSYGRQFTNLHYHSLYDDDYNVGFRYANGSHTVANSLQAFVANFSTTLAHSLYQEMTGADADHRQVVDRRLVDELLHCYVNTLGCKFAHDVDFVIETVPGQKLDYYVGVSMMRNQLTMLTRHAFVHLLSRNVTVAGQEECGLKENPTQYTHVYWSDASSRCLESATNVSDAISPAFIIAEYDLADGVYSSWTESSWQTIDVRMFLQPSPRYEKLVFMIGNVIMFTSFVTLFWIKRNSRELFNYPHLMTASNI